MTDIPDPDDAGIDLDAEFAAMVDTGEAIEPDLVAPPSSPPGPSPGTEYTSCEEALEDAIGSLEAVTSERDEYLAVAQRVQADFENYKRRVDSQRIDQVRRAAEGLVAELLPVLDACDAAVQHGIEDVAPIQTTLFGTLEKQGLERIDQTEIAFDPNCHEAVLSEEGDGIDGAPAVAEVLRTGYQWNGRVLRPAMVKVRG